MLMLKTIKYIFDYRDLKDWMSDKNNEYIGGKEVTFIDGEPFVH